MTEAEEYKAEADKVLLSRGDDKGLLIPSHLKTQEEVLEFLLSVKPNNSKEHIGISVE